MDQVIQVNGPSSRRTPLDRNSRKWRHCTLEILLMIGYIKVNFWWKHYLFHSFWVAMDLIRCPGLLNETFGRLGVPRVPNLGLSGSNLQLWILSHFDAYTSFYSILALIGWEKQLHAHHTQIFAPTGMGMCKILHIHTFKTHSNTTTSLCTFTVEQSYFLWFTQLARINILIRGRVGQGQDLKSHINQC